MHNEQISSNLIGQALVSSLDVEIIDRTQLATVSGGGWSDILNKIGNDAENGAAVGGVVGGVTGSVVGGTAGAGVGAVPGFFAGAEAGIVLGGVGGAVWGLGRGIKDELFHKSTRRRSNGITSASGHVLVHVHALGDRGEPMQLYDELT